MFEDPIDTLINNFIVPTMGGIGIFGNIFLLAVLFREKERSSL